MKTIALVILALTASYLSHGQSSFDIKQIKQKYHPGHFHSFVGFEMKGMADVDSCYRIRVFEGDSLLGQVRCDGSVLITNEKALREHLMKTAYYHCFMLEFCLKP